MLKKPINESVESCKNTSSNNVTRPKSALEPITFYISDMESLAVYNNQAIDLKCCNSDGCNGKKIIQMFSIELINFSYY